MDVDHVTSESCNPLPWEKFHIFMIKNNESTIVSIRNLSYWCKEHRISFTKPITQMVECYKQHPMFTPGIYNKLLNVENILITFNQNLFQNKVTFIFNMESFQQNCIKYHLDEIITAAEKAKNDLHISLYPANSSTPLAVHLKGLALLHSFDYKQILLDFTQLNESVKSATHKGKVVAYMEFMRTNISASLLPKTIDEIKSDNSMCNMFITLLHESNTLNTDEKIITYNLFYAAFITYCNFNLKQDFSNLDLITKIFKDTFLYIMEHSINSKL